VRRTQIRPAGLPPSWHLAAIEHAADAIVVTDLDGAIRYVNPAFERNSGLGRENVLGQDVHRLASAEQPVAALDGLRAAICHGETSAVGEWIPSADWAQERSAHQQMAETARELAGRVRSEPHCVSARELRLGTPADRSTRRPPDHCAGT
jgi:PAS domain-containing protein